MLFKHYKGKYYWSQGLAISASNGTGATNPVVVYSPLYRCEYKLFIRDYKEFHQEVKDPQDGTKTVKRFAVVPCGVLIGGLLRLLNFFRLLFNRK